MAGIVVLGVCGLSAGLMLARDGHQVTVLKHDDAPVPRSCEDAWEQWSRGGRDAVPPGPPAGCGGPRDA